MWQVACWLGTNSDVCKHVYLHSRSQSCVWSHAPIPLRSLFGELESPEQLYQHFSKLRDSSSGTSLPAMPSLGPGLDASVLAVLEACLRLDPAARPTARELLEMEFFCKEY